MKFNDLSPTKDEFSEVLLHEFNSLILFFRSTVFRSKVFCFYVIALLTFNTAKAQCSYTGSPLTQVGSVYTFCVDNGMTYTSGTVNSGQYILVNVVKGFTYTFSVGNVFTANENLTILDASTNGNVSPATFASGASGATISNWVSSLSGQIKVLLSRGSCSNANVAGGAITLTLNAVGNTQDSQTAYGTDQWVAHVYNWTGSPAPGGASPTTPSTTIAPFNNASYVGYYTVGTESISETFGGDYNCFPVYSNGVVRTNMYTEQFAVRYRMRSTKTGCYSLSTTGDDGVRVYVDGVKVYDEWKEQSPTSYANILLYLNGNSDIIFDYYENGGQNVNSFSLTPFDGSSNTIAQSSKTVCSGVSPGALNGSAYPYTGSSTNPTISFQWQSSTDNVNFTNITGATTEDYTPPTQTTTTTNVVRYYRRIVTAAAATVSGCTYTSNVSTVITSPGVPATPGIISGTTAQCPSLSGQTYSIAAVSNTVSYNWTVPTGWTITSGAGTTSITVTTGNSGQNGNISVSAVNGCGSSTVRTLAVTVNANNTAGAASSTPTLCINTALTAITHTTTGATGIGTAAGLPAGVTASWASNVITISGTPTASGTFSYSIPLTGGCGSVNATGTITVKANNTAGTASSTPTLCINSALTAITHATTGATGIGTATGLPAGVTALWTSNTITISGTPTVSGTFNYTIPLTGGCGSANATGTITVTANNTAGAASSTPTLCINSALTAITHTTTGATGIGTATGLPAGVTASWASNVITISGTPTASGTFSYSIPLTGGCGSVNATGTITVKANNNVGAASSAPTLCVNSALTAITHTTTGATGIGTATGLPAGVTASWASNTITISGTPTASGTFNYSIPLTGGCGSVSATGTITVKVNTAGAASSTPTLCIGTALTAITHATTGATGIGTATGLPTGVTASWASNTITISGTPTASGTYNYTIPLTGGCGSVNATGTITVTANNTAGAASSTPTLCINTALTAITHTTTGATGIGTATGLPTGVTASWAANVVTISGTPTASGTFNYTIPLTGGCSSVNATGTITVKANNTAGVASSTPTLCVNSALTAITHATTGATGIGTATGLPTGVTASWASNTITISGTPNASGTFNYTIPLTGGCGSVSATGTITVKVNTVGAASSTPTLCIGTALTAITHATTGATGIGTATGLPAGVTASWASNVITISGTPTASGTFNYIIPLTGGCGSANATGTITVRAASTAAVISGTAAICAGNTTNIQVAVTGGTSPYTVVYSGGTVGSYVSGSNIPVTPTSSTTYTITSVTDANGCVGSGNSGSAVVSIDLTTSTNGGVSWSNGSPAAGKSVVFDGSTVTLGTNFNACSLRLKNNALVSVASGFDVTLSGPVVVEAGSTFTLNNNANLLQTIPTGVTYSNSGNIVVKRNSSALKRLDYTLWSSPVTGQGLYSFSPSTFGNRFYVYRTSTNLYNNADVGFSLTALDANGVNGTDSNGVQFATAKGYLIRMPWDHPTAATVWNGSFTGVPNNGDINYTMNNGGTGQRFNLVGNPYPSPIDMTQFVSDNSSNITGTLYFWRETNNNTSNNAYCSWAGGTFVSNNEAQVFNPNGIIRTGQGFFVEASGSATTLAFKNGQRSTDNSNQFFRTNPNAANDVVEYNRFWLNLTNSSGAFSQMAAGYMTNATNGVDFYDGRNINTGSVLLTSILDNADYAIQGKSLPFDSSDVIPLSYKVGTAGSYTIAIDHVDGLFTGGAQAIYLKDNLTSIVSNLQTGAYTFASDAGTFTNRFEIIYQPQLSTPVFTANRVVVYNQNNEFVINTGSVTMASVKVFDLRGRLLLEKDGVNSNLTTIGAGLANQALLIRITSDEGITVTKKVIK